MTKLVPTSYPLHPRGISIVEVLLVLLLGAFLAVLSINLLSLKPTGTWRRLAHDYMENLSALYQQVVLSHGAGPISAVTVCPKAPCEDRPVFPRGMADVIRELETTRRLETEPPMYAEYPGGFWVYLFPDDPLIPDPNEELPEDTGRRDDVMRDTNDYEWLLLDMNGDEGPNTLAKEGDRVLLHVDDASGKVQTAYDVCLERSCSVPVPASFLDPMPKTRKPGDPPEEEALE